MNMFKTAAIVALALITSSAAQASNEGPVHILSYTPQYNGRVFFATDGQRNNLPACASASNRWVIDSTTPSGQAMVAGMLTAYALGKTLSVIGTGDCSVWADTETVVYFTAF